MKADEITRILTPVCKELWNNSRYEEADALRDAMKAVRELDIIRQARRIINRDETVAL